MADTRSLKTAVEPYVRAWLAKRFGTPFRSEFLALSNTSSGSAKHEFDAVSEDGSIVCGIKTASWKTSGGKRGSGKIHGAYAELYFLDHVNARQKYLVLTDPEFFENLRRDSKGKLTPGVELLHCELPNDLKAEVERIRVASRSELGA